MSALDEVGTYFLCSRCEVPGLIKKAERERDQLLKEFSAFYTGAFELRIYDRVHFRGRSIAGDLFVGGVFCRQYDPVDLCFLDLNEIILTRLLWLRQEETT